MRVTNISDHPWDTDTGGILAPGQSGEAGDSGRVADAVAVGQLREADPEPAPEQPPPAPPLTRPTGVGKSRTDDSSRGDRQ